MRPFISFDISVFFLPICKSSSGELVPKACAVCKNKGAGRYEYIIAGDIDRRVYTVVKFSECKGLLSGTGTDIEHIEGVIQCYTPLCEKHIVKYGVEKVCYDKHKGEHTHSA